MSDKCEGCGGEDCACCEVFIEQQQIFEEENGWGF